MESRQRTQKQPPAPALIGGRFQLVEPIGEGAMATVYRAYDRHLKVYRAIKRLSPALLRHDKVRARFASEAQLLAMVEHPNIVRMFDVLLDEGCLVMELVEGGSLVERLLSTGPIPPEEAVRITIGILRALEAAHERGVVHRDIKPHNILLTIDGDIKVTDFGVARLIHRTDEITRTGATMGTWAFMAPEQRADAKSADGRADIYSTGATLYALLTAETPRDLFAAEIDPALLVRIPPTLRRVIKKATSYRREDRYVDPQAMIDALHGAASEGLDGGTIIPDPSVSLSEPQSRKPRMLRPEMLSPARDQEHRPVAIAIDAPGLEHTAALDEADFYEDDEYSDEDLTWPGDVAEQRSSRVFAAFVCIGAFLGTLLWGMTRSEPIDEVNLDVAVPTMLEPIEVLEEEAPATVTTAEAAPAEVQNSSASAPAVAEPEVAATQLVAEPVVAEPVVAEPVVAEPVVAEPAVAEPAVAEPVVAEPVVAEPVVAEPVVAEPVVAEPVVAEPVVAEPVVAEPVVAEPEVEATTLTPPSSQAAVEGADEESFDEDLVGRIVPVNEPVVAEPVVAEPVVAEPVVAEPVVAEPEAAEEEAFDAGVVGRIVPQSGETSDPE